MASSAFHNRSNSLPSRPHPLTSVLDEQLSRLRSSESASTSTSLIQKLNSLESAEKWLQVPSSQESLDNVNVDELLQGSLMLLDLCNSAKDALSQTKEHVQEIQSILRRKGRSGDKLAKEIRMYLSSKKTRRKAILKALKSLKHKGNKHSLLEEIIVISLNVLELLLSFVAGPGPERKKSNLSLVSKLLHSKTVGCKEEQGQNEIANTENTFFSLMEGKSEKVRIEMVQVELQNSKSCIQDLEEGIEGLFKQLIKARVALLSISN